MHKTFVAADDLLLDSFRLARKIAEAGFRPDFLVGLWRGGSAVGIAVQEGLEHFGIATDHIAIRTSYAGQASYTQMVNKADSIRVHGLQYLLEHTGAEHSMLIVDDVYGTGKSVQAVINELTRKTRRNLPQDIRTAAVWYRPGERTVRPPDYYLHETQDWLVLPYELSGLTVDELKAHKPELQPVIERLRELAPGGGNG
ncbi:phosphoribosyltransferase [Woeseia oceani]|uniref:Hypoxanthine phosphoribosyltransferase n=1 Tax=Woeseia oceani TaxID=1548547 RepID=A0A193LIV7_9GAMM|nr:phosphoribosyltransferase family protein [Woeseia oceani]ANO52378.1 hypoxanthine phosphoribosyltransferase [Woeseia oceani]